MMRWSHCVGVVAVLVLAAVLAPRATHAQTSDATLTVSLRAAGEGQFNNLGRIATRVWVLTRSGVAPRWNGPTSIYAPTSGAVGAGGTFTVTVGSLYSSTRVPGNSYTVHLEWDDTARRTADFGPVTVRPGSNSAGPYTVENRAPPAASRVQCYPDAPDRSSRMYVYWSFPATRPVDFDRFELHRGTRSGFTLSATSRVTSPPYGVSNYTDTALVVSTDYWYCLRVLDQYGAASDTCTATACRTEPPRMDAAPDTAMDTAPDTEPDTAMDTAMEDTAPPDTALEVAEDSQADTAAPPDREEDAAVMDLGATDAGAMDAPEEPTRPDGPGMPERPMRDTPAEPPVPEDVGGGRDATPMADGPNRPEAGMGDRGPPEEPMTVDANDGGSDAPAVDAGAADGAQGDGMGPSTDGGEDGGGADGGSGGSAAGCGCRAAGAGRGGAWALLGALGAGYLARRRGRKTGARAADGG
ncbi:MAG: hypothetical protein HY909_14795 [Deltaproteobacteria bacterium]|nr:hypothetical protein [Deltaproteobacteria bacterium]